MEYQTDQTARPLSDWCEECGSVLWWRFPIMEPPWVGTPLDSDWPTVDEDGQEQAYYTHWTSVPLPANPVGALC
jgi:hypothetical protein